MCFFLIIIELLFFIDEIHKKNPEQVFLSGIILLAQKCAEIFI